MGDNVILKLGFNYIYQHGFLGDVKRRLVHLCNDAINYFDVFSLCWFSFSLDSKELSFLVRL